MSTPSAGAARPATPPTHGCVRCGAPVSLDVSMCEQCNPLGLQQPATSQVHGTVFLALVVAIVVLAVAARATLAGVGPFRAAVVDIAPVATGLSVTLDVTNEGSSRGATTCRLTRTELRGVGVAAIIESPRIGPGETRRFSSTTDRFGTDPVELSITCENP